MTDRYDDDREYSKAVKRVDSTPELEPHRETILYDWQESGDHWNWIGYASTQSIVDWAESVEQDQANEEAFDAIGG